MRANVANLSSYEEDVLEAGTYEVEVTKVEEVTANSGTEGMRLSFRILDGPDTRLGAPSQGRALSDTLWYPNASMKDGGNFAGVRLKKACEIAGVTMDEKGFDCEDFLGTSFGVKVKLEEYEGTVNAKVSNYVAV